jgi:serine/threonine protein kinase
MPPTSSECARGLQFMHKLKYMHRDIKSLNVFLDGNMVAKVADFGKLPSKRTEHTVTGN